MNDIVIRADNLSKAYDIRHGVEKSKYATIQESLLSLPKRIFGKRETVETFWALKDVSFEVRQGDRIGIIGRNGAGKSTLLKLLCRITEPTSGEAVINGRVASLLEVGTGFHPELTGRENIFMNGAILGMTRAEIRKKFDEIVAFAEVEKFIDTPVKRYSSGMYVRLAFAVAAHLEPEILVVDEVLAVGDAEFQKKCLGKMREVSRNEGRTILFVSHNMAAIQQLCSKGIILYKGRNFYAGTANEAVEKYITMTDAKTTFAEDGFVDLENAREKVYQAKVFKRIGVFDKENNPCRTFPMLGSMKIEVEFDHQDKFPNADYAIYIDTLSGIRVTTYLPGWTLPNYGNIMPKTAILHINSLRLNSGSYRIGLSAAYLNVGEFIDLVENACTFNIEAVDIFRVGKLYPSYCGLLLPEGHFSFT